MNTIDVWSNVNGWDWYIDTAEFRVESNRCFRTAEGAIANAQKIAAKCGIKRTRAEVSRDYDACVKRGDAYYTWQRPEEVPARATDAITEAR